MFKGLILIDNDQVDYSLDLTEVVHRLAGEEETFVYGLGINLPEEVTGLDEVINVEMSTTQLKDSRIITDIIEQVHREYQFDSIIILATEFGRMVAPRLAMRLEVGLVADITDIHVDKRGKNWCDRLFQAILWQVSCVIHHRSWQVFIRMFFMQRT